MIKKRKEVFKKIFEKIKEKIYFIYAHQYKKLLWIPFLLVLFALGVLVHNYLVTGDFVNKGVSLKGGTTITIDQPFDSKEIEEYLKQKFPEREITVRTLSSAGKSIGIAVDSDAQENKEIQSLTLALEEKLNLKKEDYGVEVIGSSLSKSFFRQAFVALVIAFLLMGGVVFLYFKTLAPGLAVILAAFSDILVTLALFNLTGNKLSTAGIAAFLMLIGYSVDTDILLSTWVLKRRGGSVMERVLGAMKTGLTMSLTSLIVILVAFFLVRSEVIKQIMLILLLGLLVDLVMTWIQNAGILRIYLERKNKS